MNSVSMNSDVFSCLFLLIKSVFSLAENLWILRLAATLWYAERGDLITSCYTLLQVVVLDQRLVFYQIFRSTLRNYLILDLDNSYFFSESRSFSNDLLWFFFTLGSHYEPLRENPSDWGAPNCK